MYHAVAERLPCCCNREDRTQSQEKVKCQKSQKLCERRHIVARKAPVKPVTTHNAGRAIGFGQFKAEVEKKAKEIYLKRQETKVSGDALSDWLKAESEIKSKYHIA
jgi:hypothetical protein